MTISMFAFPFSIVLPISLAGAGGMGSFRFVDIMNNNENMTPGWSEITSVKIGQNKEEHNLTPLYS